MNTQRGYILVQALVVIAGLLALMAMLAADQRVSTQTVQNRLRQRRADAAADAAVARALAAVQETHPSLVTLNDDWAQVGDSGNDAFDLNGASFRVQLVDAGAMINVNTAPEPQLQRLPLTQEQIHCLLDWREPKTGARPDGAKDSYYQSLPTPYNAKLEPLSTLNELLSVKNWTGQTLYQTPPSASADQLLTGPNGNSLPLASLLTADSGTGNTKADGTPRLDLGQPGTDQNELMKVGVSADSARQISAQAPFQSFGTLLAVPGLSSETVSALLDSAAFSEAKTTPGKINLNTAPEAVLRTVPNVTPALASAIVTRQSAGFRRLSDLVSLPGMNAELLAKLADSFTVGSNTWVVRAYGQSGGIATAVEAVIGLREGRAEILTWTRLNTTGIPSWWGWNTSPTSTANAEDAR